MVGAETRKEWREIKKQELASEYNSRVLTGEIDEKELQEYLGLPRSSYIRYRDECRDKKMIKTEPTVQAVTVTQDWIDDIERRFVCVTESRNADELEDWFHEFHHFITIFRHNIGMWSRDYAKLSNTLSLVATIINGQRLQENCHAREILDVIVRMRHIFLTANSAQQKNTSTGAG